MCISQFLVLVERMKQRSRCTISMKYDQSVLLGPEYDLNLVKSLWSSMKLSDDTRFCMFADVSFRRNLKPARTSHPSQVYHSLVLLPSTPRMRPNVGATWLDTLASVNRWYSCSAVHLILDQRCHMPGYRPQSVHLADQHLHNDVR